MQAGFDRKSALAEFGDFQQRLRHDVDEINNRDMTAENEVGNGAVERLRKAFTDSLSAGPKGDVLRLPLAEPTVPGIIPPQQIFWLKVQETACPVGFGGKFIDDGHEVELWYVDLDPADSDVLGAFSEPTLPAYGSLQRDQFPTLVFERDEKGRLKWYGVSSEKDAILRYWLDIQMQ